MNEVFPSVLLFLESQRCNRPVSLQEVLKRVGKSERASAREISLLLLRGSVRVLVIRFSSVEYSGLLLRQRPRDMVLYTLNRDVVATIVKQGTRF